MKLYTNKDSFDCFQLELAASFANQNMPVFNDTNGLTDTESSRFKLNDTFLETSKGTIYGADAIFRFIGKMWPEHTLYGESMYQQAEVDMWIHFASDMLTNMFPQTQNKFNGDAVNRSFEGLENHLMDTTYLVGQNITLADIAVAAVIHQAKFVSKFDHSGFMNVTRWFNTMTQQKAFTKVVSKADNSMKQAKPEKKASAKQAETASANKPASTTAEEDVGVLVLPVLDEWKKFYSNSKNKSEEAMTWFWNKKELQQKYSLWYMQYQKLPTEGKFDFITCNMLAGFMQRVDNAMRGQSFGMVHVVGENKDFDVQGVWMFEGDDVPQLMKEHPSFEYNKFTKLDWNNPDHQQLVSEYWCNTETVEGRPVVVIQPWK